MPAFRIPVTQGNWTGQYQGDYYGDIRRSYNIDLERNPGKIELASKHNMVFNSDSTSPGDSNFARVEAFVRIREGLSDSITRHYASVFEDYDTTRDRVTLYRTADTNGDTSWASDTNSIVGGVTYNFQDMVVFRNPNSAPSDRIFASTNDTSVLALSSAAWAAYTGLGIMDTGTFHPLDVFEGNLLVASRHKIHTLDNTDSAVINSRVVVPPQYHVHHIFHIPSRVFLLGANANLEGVISEWDGFSALPIRNHQIEGVPISGVDYYGTPIILTSKGGFLQYTGASFVQLRDNFGEVIAIPINRQFRNSLLGTGDFPLNPARFAVARRGMVVDGEVIKFNLARPRTQPNGEFDLSSGLWILNPIKKTLYHAGSLAPDDNFGHSFVRRSGAMFTGQEGGIKLASANFYTAFNDCNFDSSNRSAISTFLDFADTELQRGFIEFQFRNIPQPEATWETFWVKHKKFPDTNTRMLAKARIEKGPYFNDTDIELRNLVKVDFDDDTAFAVEFQSDSSDSLIVGDEIEVLAGPNAGKLAHITAISGTHGDTQTCTIDETFDSSSSLSLATFRRWKKLQTPAGDCSVTASDSLMVHRFVIPAEIKNAPSISIKLELRGRPKDITIEEAALQFEVNKQIKT